MSPNNPGNFVNDLVEMAKAFEALPKVQADLEQVRSDVNGYLSTIQRLELKLVDRANEIDSLNSRIRTLEVDRDHAETMFLEADDRTARALDFIKATFGNAGSLIQALEPVKAQPEPVTMPMNEPEPIPAWATPEVDHTGDYIPKAEPEGLHTTSAAPWSAHAPDGTVSPGEADASPASPAPEVASAHPTSTTDANTPKDTMAPEGSVSDTVTPTANATGDQSFPMPPISPGRYAGKTWTAVREAQGWVPSKDEWLDGGGSIDNFYA